MNETNFDWDDLRLFLAIARAGGLAGAASVTGKSSPTLGRRMLEMERRLGKELFRRLPRGYELTEDGERLLVTASELEQKITPLVETADNSLAKLVKISAGTWVTSLLCESLPQLVPQESVRLRFISADHFLDMRRREAVIGIRNQRPQEVGLAGRRITEVQFAVYARDDSIKTWAKVMGTTPSARWVAENIQSAPTIEITNPRNALDLALSGDTRAVLPTFIGDAHSPLKRISDTIEDLRHDQWLVTHQEDRFLPEVRSVIDHVYDVLRTATTV